MTFSVYGAGVRDNVPFTVPSEFEVVEELYPTTAVKKVGPRGEEEEEKENLYRQKSAQKAYQSTHHLQRERGLALHAHQIMTSPVVTLNLDTSITQAWSLFRERRFRHVPVVMENRKIYGIVSDRDLLRYAAVSGKIPPFSDNSIEAKTSIESLIKTRVITSAVDTEIREIARMLFEQRIGAMPVVTETGLLEGIITRSDILRTLVNHAPLELWV